MSGNGTNEESEAPTSGDEYFWQCFFLASIRSTSRRQGALTYLAKRLPSLAKTKRRASSSTKHRASDLLEKPKRGQISAAAEAVVSPEPGLLVRCLISGLEDEQMLVQRGFLDLLLSHLPLDSPVLVHRIASHDLVRLIGAATGVVARRDMSLNRRLWSWFLGPQANNAADEQETSMSPDSSRDKHNQRSSPAMAYFEQYGVGTLRQCILQMLGERPQQPAKRARPFRICLSLMDRWEIGSAIVPSIFLPAMENIHEYNSSSQDQDFQDVLRSANSFFDGVESRIIWGKIAELTTHALKSSRIDIAKMQLAEFIVRNFNVREEEMLAFHTPLLILLLLTSIRSLEATQSSEKQPDLEERVIVSLPLVVQLLSSLPERRNSISLPTADQDVPPAETTLPEPKRLIDTIQALYGYNEEESFNVEDELPSGRIDTLLIAESTDLAVRFQMKNALFDSIVLRSRVFTLTLSKIRIPSNFDPTPLLSTAERGLASLNTLRTENTSSSGLPPKPAVGFPALNAISSMLSSMVNSNVRFDWQNSEIFPSVVSVLVRHLWDHLSPSRPRYHIEAVRCLWQLEELLTPDQSVEALITGFFAESINGVKPLAIENAKRFAVLWGHTSSTSTQSARSVTGTWSRSFSVASDLQSVKARPAVDNQAKLFRPLFLLLDTCDEEDSELQAFVKAWLDGLPNMSRLFDVLTSKIHASHSIHQTQPNGSISEAFIPQTSHQNRDGECLYYVQRLQNLLRSKSPYIWAALLEPHKDAAHLDDEKDAESILSFMVTTCLEILENGSNVPSQVGIDSRKSLQQACASLILTILTSPVAANLEGKNLEKTFIDLLRQNQHSAEGRTSMQVVILDLVMAALKSRSLSPIISKRSKGHRRVSSVDMLKNQLSNGHNSPSTDVPKSGEMTIDPQLLAELVKSIQEGLESADSVFVLERWVQFLVDLLPSFAATLFQCIIPLVEAFCKRIRQTFEGLCASFGQVPLDDLKASPEPALIALFNGLEYLLAAGHDQMSLEDSKSAPLKSPEPTQGFFGNVVSGVFSTEVQKSRPTPANTRLTVILCFQDALKICLSVWSWGSYGSALAQPDPSSLASFAYVSQRLRNRTRKILDRMFSVEGLECLETLIVAWTLQGTLSETKEQSSVISLLHVLDSSTPKQTMPALFNSIYSRTSPTSLEPQRMSSLTSDITDVELAQFLLDYTKSLDDDAMDEIWTDCMTFLRDVLTNPLPHSQILPSLLQFLIILAEKVDKTNFGEQRKMRRELGVSISAASIVSITDFETRICSSASSLPLLPLDLAASAMKCTLPMLTVPLMDALQKRNSGKGT